MMAIDISNSDGGWKQDGTDADGVKTGRIRRWVAAGATDSAGGFVAGDCSGAGATATALETAPKQIKYVWVSLNTKLL